MSAQRQRAPRLEIEAIMRRLDREVSTVELAAARGRSVAGTVHLLYALREEGVVTSRWVTTHGPRHMRWALTGAPLADTAVSTREVFSRGAAARDHTALAQALGMCLQAPREIQPTRVHTTDGGEG